MKHFIQLAAYCACMGLVPVQASAQVGLSQPDSIYLFSYATTPDEGRSGLKFAWSRDGEEWFSIGNGHGYVKCDYGAWGKEKRMIKPELYRDAQGVWHCIWQLNGNGKEFAHAASDETCPKKVHCKKPPGTMWNGCNGLPKAANTGTCCLTNKPIRTRPVFPAFNP